MGLQIKLEIRASNVEISVVEGVRDSDHSETAAVNASQRLYSLICVSAKTTAAIWLRTFQLMH